MLILSRKAGQKIVISDNIEITVLEVRGEHVRIGIAAPREIPVHRYELWNQVVMENQVAQESSVSTPDSEKTLAVVD